MGKGSTDSIVLWITDLSHDMTPSWSGYGIPGVDAVLRRMEVAGFPILYTLFYALLCTDMHHIFLMPHTLSLERFRFSLSLSRVVVGDLPYTNLALRSLSKTYAMIRYRFLLKEKFSGPFRFRRQGLFCSFRLTCMAVPQGLSFGRESCTLTYGTHKIGEMLTGVERSQARWPLPGASPSWTRYLSGRCGRCGRLWLWSNDGRDNATLTTDRPTRY